MRELNSNDISMVNGGAYTVSKVVEEALEGALFGALYGAICSQTIEGFGKCCAIGAAIFGGIAAIRMIAQQVDNVAFAQPPSF